jgi:large subunit ribosomal protein L30
MSKVAVIRVRGSIRDSHTIDDTFVMLNISKKNWCSVWDVNDSVMGMINKVKDFSTWGNINDETLKLLEEKKGKGKFFRLNPPVKGFGRKGVKVVFTAGGALGDRKEKINDLIRRML